jgi:cyclin-dependent kinase 3
VPYWLLRELAHLHELSCHPNIVTLHDVFYKPGDREVLVEMELMFCDLITFIEDNHVSLSCQLISLATRQLLEALAFTHGRFILHRDIKPENILVNREGTLFKIADFGLSRRGNKHLAPSHVSGTAPLGHPHTQQVCTLNFRAPELLLGEKRYTYAMDMWSVGCVLAEISRYGDVLFGGSEDKVVLQQICKQLGTPTSTRGILTLDSPVLPACLQAMPKYCGRHWESVLSLYNDQLLSLLRQLVTWQPGQRLSAHAALHHAFVQTAVVEV